MESKCPYCHWWITNYTVDRCMAHFMFTHPDIMNEYLRSGFLPENVYIRPEGIFKHNFISLSLRYI